VVEPSNITWHLSGVSRADRMHLNGHVSKVIWFTGLSGAGKSTLAVNLERKLYNFGIRTYILDGDNVRHGLNSNLGFTPEDRKENIRRLGEMSKLFIDAGMFVLTCAISPYEEERIAVRNLFASDDFIEIYVKCDINVCESRDPKGLYKKARKGEVREFTGISAPYEEPSFPDLIIETDKSNIDESIEKIIDYLSTRGYLQ